MASGINANVIAFPDLPPKGSRGSGGKRALMGPEIGTSFDYGQRLFAYYGEGDVFLAGRLRFLGRPRYEDDVRQKWHVFGNRAGSDAADSRCPVHDRPGQGRQGRG